MGAADDNTPPVQGGPIAKVAASPEDDVAVRDGRFGAQPGSVGDIQDNGDGYILVVSLRRASIAALCIALIAANAARAADALQPAFPRQFSRHLCAQRT